MATSEEPAMSASPPAGQPSFPPFDSCDALCTALAEKLDITKEAEWLWFTGTFVTTDVKKEDDESEDVNGEKAMSWFVDQVARSSGLRFKVGQRFPLLKSRYECTQDISDGQRCQGKLDLALHFLAGGGARFDISVKHQNTHPVSPSSRANTPDSPALSDSVDTPQDMAELEIGEVLLMELTPSYQLEQNSYSSPTPTYTARTMKRQSGSKTHKPREQKQPQRMRAAGTWTSPRKLAREGRTEDDSGSPIGELPRGVEGAQEIRSPGKVSTRRVDPDKLAERLGPDMVAELNHFLVPGAKMPTWEERKALQDKYKVDRRHVYDYLHSRGLRVSNEAKHMNLQRNNLARSGGSIRGDSQTSDPDLGYSPIKTEPDHESFDIIGSTSQHPLDDQYESEEVLESAHLQPEAGPSSVSSPPAPQMMGSKMGGMSLRRSARSSLGSSKPSSRPVSERKPPPSRSQDLDMVSAPATTDVTSPTSLKIRFKMPLNQNQAKRPLCVQCSKPLPQRGSAAGSDLCAACKGKRATRQSSRKRSSAGATRGPMYSDDDSDVDAGDDDDDGGMGDGDVSDAGSARTRNLANAPAGSRPCSVKSCSSVLAPSYKFKCCEKCRARFRAYNQGTRKVKQAEAASTSSAQGEGEGRADSPPAISQSGVSASASANGKSMALAKPKGRPPKKRRRVSAAALDAQDDEQDDMNGEVKSEDEVAVAMDVTPEDMELVAEEEIGVRAPPRVVPAVKTTARVLRRGHVAAS